MDNTNPIRKYYVVPIVIAIVSIIIFSQIWIIMERSTLKKILVLANVFGASLIIIVVLWP